MQNCKIYVTFIVVISLTACNDSIKYPEGGYDYPKHVADIDTNFYYYPVKDVMPKRDSLSYTVTYLLFRQYDEPNLSLRPLGHDEFRLQYNAALGGFYLITLTKNSIQIKKEIYHEEPFFDETRLTQTEQRILNTIRYNYPYNNLSNYRKKYIDSIKIASPEVLMPDYFIYLLKKAFTYIDPQKIYTTTIIKITDEDFKHLIQTINNSGYWKMPYSFNCKEDGADGYGYMLEANTRNKYNLVSATSCDDSSQQRIKFSKACQEIINYAHLEKEIFLWSDEYMTGTDTTGGNIVVQDVPFEDIQPPHQKHRKKKSYLHNKEQKVQGSDSARAKP